MALLGTALKYTKSIFSFSDIDNKELYSTIQGKKIKFTTFSKIQINTF